MVARIIVDILNKQVNKEFDYQIPSYLEGIVDIGYRVKVEFARRKVTGFVVGIKEDTDFKGKIKEIIEVVDTYPVLNKELIDVAYYIVDNYFSYYYTALDMMIPSALKYKQENIAIVLDETKNELKDYTVKNTIKLSMLNKEQLAIIYNGVKNNIYSLDVSLKKQRNEQYETYISLNYDYNGNDLTYKQQKLLNYLEEIGETHIDEFIKNSGFTKNMVNKLCELNAINIDKREILKLEYSKELVDKRVTLNEEQQNAIDKIKLDENTTYLIHGITGSGKTEIYMNLIEEVIKENKTALMLVPEISLTPQISALFLARFKKDIAILHSKLSVKDKYIAYKKILNKEIKIVVGARSAVFAPLDNIGIIIIDEEHESSYIQDNNPKYSAIEIAKIRAKTNNCPLVLGSATPKVSDYYYAINNNYELITLKKRTNNLPLPLCEVVDLREELKKGNTSVFSTKLQKELQSNYDNKHQSILFLNRRGFSSFVMCRSCGEEVKCIHCDISLTYHQRTNTLVCHHCGYKIPNVSTCQNCGSSKIRFVGSGTEKIEEEMNKLIPQARVLRMDYDTTRDKDAYEQAFNKIANNEVDIVIGTKMITKGLDFENVTLVGVLNADLALKYPEYDANEEAFNLIEQVSGRAGRKNNEGKVIIQTYNPEHFVIKTASVHDYNTYFNKEINLRKLTNMPPYSTYLVLKVSSKNNDLAYKEAKTIINYLKKDKDDSIILGPVPDYIFKKKDEYRFNIEVQALTDSILEKVRYIYPLYQDNKDINISITRK